MPVWRDIGNINKLPITPQPEIKEHFSSRTGVKEVDKIAIIAKKIEFAAEVDEWTFENSLMALLGLEVTDGTMEIMGASSVERQLKFTGTNDFGPRVEMIFPRVFMLCKDAINLIGDDWQPLPLSGQILRAGVVSGSFGTMTFLSGATGSAPITSPSTLNYYIGKGILSVADVGT